MTRCSVSLNSSSRPDADAAARCRQLCGVQLKTTIDSARRGDHASAVWHTYPETTQRSSSGTRRLHVDTTPTTPTTPLHHDNGDWRNDKNTIIVATRVSPKVPAGVLEVLEALEPAAGGQPDLRRGLDLGDVPLGDLHDAHVGGQHDEEGQAQAAQHQKEGEAHLRHPHGVADGHGLGLEAVVAPAQQRQPGQQAAQRPQRHQGHGQALRGHLRRVPGGGRGHRCERYRDFFLK